MLQYLIKLSISLSIVYLFYQLLLRRLTFYNWNRWYLLIYSLVCFVIPFINVFTIIVERPALRESAFINYIPAITQMSPATEVVTTTEANGINWLQVGVVVMVSGMLFMVVRLLLQYYSLYKMRSKAVLLYDENVKLYHINEPVMPFSFGRGIYVNQHQHSEDELKDIIRHEFIHVKQRHSLDILWSELLCILNWYNPFAWLLRHDIRQNLEFIADQQVLQTGLDRKQYQYLLLKVIGVNSYSIATNFNFSSLKRRIAMMNKTQSARVHLTRFLFLLPLLVVVLLAFRNTNQERRQLQREKQLKTDTVPNTVKQSQAWKDVENIDVIDNRKVTIKLKNGKVERYDMQITREREAFENKYGSLPEPPPAPKVPGFNEKELPERPELPEKPEKPEAPEKAEMPEKLEAPEKEEIPEAPEAPNPPDIFAYGPGKVVVHSKPIGVPEPPAAPEKPTINLQDCLNKKGYCITVADNFGECIVIVKDKNNKIVQAIFLTDWNNDKKQYEEKYGEMPPVNLKLVPIIKQGKPAKPTTKVEYHMTVPATGVVETVAEPVPNNSGAEYNLYSRDSAGRRVPVIRGKSEKDAPRPKWVVVRGKAPALHADAVAVPKPAGSINTTPNELVVLGIQKEPKTAVSAKTAPTAKVKVDEVVVVGIKTEAKAAMSTKTAAEATPRVTLKLDKLKELEPAKPTPAQPKQE